MLVPGRKEYLYVGNEGSWVQQLDNSGIEIKNAHYTVSFELLPCEQMFQTIMAGELSNSATFPSNYATIHRNNLKNFPGPIRTWSYAKRLSNAAKVICASTDLLLLHNLQALVFSAYFYVLYFSGAI